MAENTTTNLVANFRSCSSKKSYDFLYFILFNDTHFLETQFQLHKIFPVFFAFWPFLPNLLFRLCFLLLPLKCWCCSWSFAWLHFLLNLSTFLGDPNHLYSLNFTYVAKHFSPTLATLLTSHEILTTASWQELHRNFQLSMFNMNHLSKNYHLPGI